MGEEEGLRGEPEGNEIGGDEEGGAVFGEEGCEECEDLAGDGGEGVEGVCEVVVWREGGGGGGEGEGFDEGCVG